MSNLRDDYDKKQRRLSIAFMVFWTLCLLLGVAFMGVIIWAIIELVQWVTA